MRYLLLLALLSPVVTTESVAHDPDDPSLWVNPANPAQSLIISTDKAAQVGGLYVFGLDGKIRQHIEGLDRPNNVDVIENIAVLTERNQNRLRAYRISPTAPHLTDISDPDGLKVFDAPMGIALYRRPKDGALFAIVSRKSGPSGSYLFQYRLTLKANKLKATKVREFGAYSGGRSNEIEAVAVDSELGYVYYADEACCIRKYHADPDHPDAPGELAKFGETGWKQQREGIAIYTQPNGKGFVICTDQIPNGTEYRVFKREGEPGRPHDHSKLVKVITTATDSTDGLEVSSANLGPKFPKGIMIAMNSRPKNFVLFDWRNLP